jgi:hypothetical protein
MDKPWEWNKIQTYSVYFDRALGRLPPRVKNQVNFEDPEVPYLLVLTVFFCSPYRKGKLGGAGNR